MMLDYFNQALASPAFQEPFTNRHMLRKKVDEAMVMMDETRSHREIDISIVRALGYLFRALAELSEAYCITHKCQNRKGEGVFVGDLCGPCHSFVARGEPQGQAWENALANMTQLARQLKKVDGN